MYTVWYCMHIHLHLHMIFKRTLHNIIHSSQFTTCWHLYHVSFLLWLFRFGQDAMSTPMVKMKDNCLMPGTWKQSLEQTFRLHGCPSSRLEMMYAIIIMNVVSFCFIYLYCVMCVKIHQVPFLYCPKWSYLVDMPLNSWWCNAILQASLGASVARQKATFLRRLWPSSVLTETVRS